MTTSVPETIADSTSIGAAFAERVRLSPDRPAYRQHDIAGQNWTSTRWGEMAHEVGRWQTALKREGLEPGDRVALMLNNSRDWVAFDLAALALGLVTVPLYNDDQPDNIAWIIEQTEARVLLVGGRAQWKRLAAIRERLGTLRRIVSIETIVVDADRDDNLHDRRLESAQDWLYGIAAELIVRSVDADALASIVYTSGTTGRPKGVMLTHRNLLTNALMATHCGPLSEHDVFLSFLPLSHTLERTAGYLMPLLLGAEVAFARSIQRLADDLATVRPTVLISVPRIYERVYARIQSGLKDKGPVARALFDACVALGWARFEARQGRGGVRAGFLVLPLLDRLVGRKVRARLGGRLTFAVCGGAPLPPKLARFFIGLGVPVYHGYGMTEASPVVAVNRPEDNLPASIGTPLPGVAVRLGALDELQTRSACVMQGYWNDPEATRAVLDAEGWLHTGDVARIDAGGHIFITGRIKDILVLSNGEKIPPADMEMAITLDPLFSQALIVGEGRPFLAAVVVLDPDAWRVLADELGVDPDDDRERLGRFVERTLLNRVGKALRDFPGYAKVRQIHAVLDPWTIDDGLLTPTLKVKRARVEHRFSDVIESLYDAYGEDAAPPS